MFSIKGKGIILKLDQPFEIDGVKYAASWLRHSSKNERDALGIVETPDTPTFDTRFYWSETTPKRLEDEEVTEDYTVVDEEGNETTETKTYTSRGLKTSWISQIKQTVNQSLQNTDWYIVRKYERDIDVPAEVEAYRAAVHAEGARLEEAILAATTVEELKEVVTHQNWPTLEA
jgi:hypothetical protein